MKEQKKSNFWQIIGLVAMIGVIVLVFVKFVDLQAVGQQLRTANYGFLALASLFLVAGLLAYAVRWRLLLGNKPSLLHTFHASNVGHAGNILIPFRAGEAARIVMMGSSDAVSITEATSSFVVERLFEQIMRFVALGGAVIYGVGLDVSFGTVAGGVGFLLAAFGGIALLIKHREGALEKGPVWLAKLPRVTEAGARESLTDLLDNLANVAEPRQLGAVLLSSAVTWICFGLFFYVTLLALDSGFPAGDRVAVALGALALSPPSAPTQPGVFHFSIVGPLTAVGFLAEPLTAYAVLLHILEMIWMIGLAVWGMAQTGMSAGSLLAKKEETGD